MRRRGKERGKGLGGIGSNGESCEEEDVRRCGGGRNGQGKWNVNKTRIKKKGVGESTKRSSENKQ